MSKWADTHQTSHLGSIRVWTAHHDTAGPVGWLEINYRTGLIGASASQALAPDEMRALAAILTAHATLLDQHIADAAEAREDAQDHMRLMRDLDDIEEAA